MKTIHTIRVKAALLLTVFSLNTLVGFACAMGLDMGFNKPYHGKEPEGAVHVHKDGKKHIHKEGAKKSHHSKGSATSKKDDCCKEKVVKLQTADKNLQYAMICINAPVFLVPGNHIEPLIFRAIQPDLQEYIACHFHPPPRDIRIDIQSFQI